MIFVKIFLLINIFLIVLVYSIHGQIAPGSNAYLPPKQTGYSYPGPPSPFKPSSPGPRPGPGPGPGPGPRPAPGPRPVPGPGPGLRPAPGPAPRPTPGFRPGPAAPPGQRPPPRGEPGPDHVHIPGMPFDFQYAVNDIATSNDYNHKAASNGDEVKGEYRVQLPDGRMQVVRYTADWKTGYHADVSYEGQPRFPQGPSGSRPGGGGGGGYQY